jgi:hypothetical protein
MGGVMGGVMGEVMEGVMGGVMGEVTGEVMGEVGIRSSVAAGAAGFKSSAVATVERSRTPSSTVGTTHIAEVIIAVFISRGTDSVRK